jgi:hypothetical protein
VQSPPLCRASLVYEVPRNAQEMSRQCRCSVCHSACRTAPRSVLTVIAETTDSTRTAVCLSVSLPSSDLVLTHIQATVKHPEVKLCITSQPFPGRFSPHSGVFSGKGAHGRQYPSRNVFRGYDLQSCSRNVPSCSSFNRHSKSCFPLHYGNQPKLRWSTVVGFVLYW